MKAKLLAVFRAWGGPAELLRDLHVYGGLMLASWGVGVLWHAGAGLVAFGTGLFYLGKRGH